MQHTEHHFTSTEVVRDIVIGMSDGLTVPFALAAGLSGTVQSTHIVVIAGPIETGVMRQFIPSFHRRSFRCDVRIYRLPARSQSLGSRGADGRTGPRRGRHGSRALTCARNPRMILR